MSSDFDIVRGLIKTSAGYVHYRAAGEGPVVVILNASGQSSSVSVELMSRLAPRARAIAFDYPGHGMSDHVPQPAMSDYADWILEAADGLGVEEAVFLGEATGNGVVLEIARRAPRRIVKAVLVNCPFHADRDSSERAHEPMKSGLRPVDSAGFPLPRTIEFLLDNDAIHAPMRPTQSWMDRINVAQAEANRDRFQLLSAFANYDLLAAFASIRCPVLQLMGEHFHYNKFRAEFERRIDDLCYEIIPEARFCAVWEFADHIGDRVARFMEPRPAKTGSRE
jgi:pimeloyl-ACP methyl ester carboxylesterase